MDDIALARDARKVRDIEREMDTVVIRESILAGSPSAQFKLLREFKTAAQSLVDAVDAKEADTNRDPMDYSSPSLARHVEWFRELLK